MRIPPLYWFLIFLLGGVWGGSFLFVKVAVVEIPPITLVFFRVFFAALILWVIVIALGKRVTPSVQSFKRWLAMGFWFNALPFTLLFYGQQSIGAGLASILNASTVMWTALFANWLLADERLTPLKTVGILLGFTGIVVMIGPAALLGIGDDVVAQLLVVAATMSYGFAAIYSRRFGKADPMVSAAGQLSGASILIAPLMLFVDGNAALNLPSTNTMLAVAGLVILSTALAYVVFFKVVAEVGSVNVSLCTFIVPIIALLLGTFILGERLELTQWLGMAAILAGLTAIDGRLFAPRTGKIGRQPKY